MNPALSYIYARLSEPSTWRGLIAPFTAAGAAELSGSRPVTSSLRRVRENPSLPQQRSAKCKTMAARTTVRQAGACEPLLLAKKWS
jgi:hypothetical protein